MLTALSQFGVFLLIAAPLAYLLDRCSAAVGRWWR